MIGIYKITNTKNNKVYIGQSINIAQRWAQHRNHLNHGTHNNDHLQRGWNKYGSDAFTFEILEECPQEELNEKEIYYINKYNSMDFSVGYNEKSGGGQERLSEYVKEKLRKPKSKPRTPEHCRKLGLAHVGQKPWNFGKATPQDVRKKQSMARMGKKPSNCKRVLCIDTGEIFHDTVVAAEKYGLYGTNIRKCCRGERSQTGGLKWKYLD